MPEGCTLAAAFGLSAAEVDHLEDVIATTPAFLAAREAMKVRVPSTFWRGVAAQAARQAVALLDVPIAEVLAGAWSRYPEIARLADASGFPDDEVWMLSLSTHTVQSELGGSVEVHADGIAPFTLAVAAAVSFEVEGGVTVRGGRIREVHGVQGWMRGSLRCEGAPVACKYGELVLPPTVGLGAGIPVVPVVHVGSGTHIVSSAAVRPQGPRPRRKAPLLL
jgi:hypothetical protein